MSTTTTPKAPARGRITVPVRLDPETRSATGELRLSGLAAPYNRTSQDIGFYEELLPGAFHSLDAGDVLLLWQHRDDSPLARRSAGNLELEDAPDGIRFSATLPSTSIARDAVELVRSGVVSEMSFGFVVEKDKWENRGGKRIRIVERAELYELSLVTEAAYGRATNVSNRNRGNVALQRRIESAVEAMRRTPTPVTESPTRLTASTPGSATNWRLPTEITNRTPLTRHVLPGSPSDTIGSEGRADSPTPSTVASRQPSSVSTSCTTTYVRRAT